MVYMDLTRQAIQDSPVWNPDTGVNRQYEARLYDYYGRPSYWDSRPQAPPQPSLRTHQA